MKYNNAIEIKGPLDGNASIVLAGVHGNEMCGVKAFSEMLEDLKIDTGRVFFIFGNPLAIAENKRFIDKNLNRMFVDENQLTAEEKESYEYVRSLFIKEYLDKSSALLDVHASNTPDSLPFIIAEENASHIVKLLPQDLVVSGFDDVQPGGTDYYMNKNGKIGICVECGYSNSLESVQIAKDSIRAFLAAQGHIEDDIQSLPKSHVQIFSQYKTKSSKFILAKDFLDFEEIKHGQLIGIDGDVKVYAETDAVILFARNRSAVNEEAFLLGKKK